MYTWIYQLTAGWSNFRAHLSWGDTVDFHDRDGHACATRLLPERCCDCENQWPHIAPFPAKSTRPPVDLHEVTRVLLASFQDLHHERSENLHKDERNLLHMQGDDFPLEKTGSSRRVIKEMNCSPRWHLELTEGWVGVWIIRWRGRSNRRTNWRSDGRMDCRTSRWTAGRQFSW